ncbi:mitochondrial ribosomal subunit protein-domain-containing protein [Paraphysoderma sedebokerense]|nr:mitochondrial ribosomal subunit protein-domain-containing protein [Paraphysoderma sedebokerense]
MSSKSLLIGLSRVSFRAVQFRSFSSTSFVLARRAPTAKRSTNPESHLIDDPQPFKNDAPTSWTAKLILETNLVKSYLEKVQGEMKQLKAYSAPFTPPSPSSFLCFRTSTHLSDPLHPHNARVTVTFPFSSFSSHYNLSQQQQHLAKLLFKNRYCDVEDKVKMSCDRFEFERMNKRWLVDMIQKVAETVKSAKDYYTDIPVTSHTPPSLLKKQRNQSLKFPEEWLIETPQTPTTSPSTTSSESTLSDTKFNSTAENPTSN